MATIPSISLPPTLTGNALTSLWDGLNPNLVASFYEVAKTGENEWGRIPDKTDPVVVLAPLTEATMEVLLNWQSPFEQAGPETRAPALMAMLSSGAIQPIVDAVIGGKKDEQKNSAQQKSDEFLKQFEGRSGITKLNSTQVFNGMPPIKIQMTAIFRAWRDPASEVEAPVNKLMEWALPIELSTDATLLARAAESARGEKDFIDALMPSKSPTRVAMKYKGRTFSPMVIESIGMPLSSPIDSSGNFVELLIPITLCSLTAIDRKDWADASVSSLV